MILNCHDGVGLRMKVTRALKLNQTNRYFQGENIIQVKILLQTADNASLKNMRGGML